MSWGAALPKGATRLKRLISGLFVAGLGLALSSCLVPQSIDPIDSREHSPPRIVVQSIPVSLLPPVLTLYRQGSADSQAEPPCHCRLELQVPEVSEDDPTVDLEGRWFVDYDLSVPRSLNVVHQENNDGDFNSTTVVRGPWSFNFEADALGIVDDGSYHVVDLVVAERAAFDKDSTSLPNRAVLTEQGYEAASYRFVVRVFTDPAHSPSTCPQELPSRRICQ
jgi:hypothetical protein